MKWRVSTRSVRFAPTVLVILIPAFQISEHMERLVMLLKGEEPPQGPSEEEEFELAATRNRLELEGSSTAATKSEAGDVEEDGPSIGSLVTDDDDNKIEEI